MTERHWQVIGSIAVIILWGMISFGAEFYSFPPVPAVQPGDKLLVRQYGTYSGTRNMTVGQLMQNYTGDSVPTPTQVFGNPTGARFPVFAGNDSWQWARPLEACVNVFDGAETIGPRGPAGEISSLTALSLPYGSAPTVTNSGSASLAILEFGIPAGATGPQGDPGSGVPTGGAIGQTLVKATTTDYDIHWSDLETELSPLFAPYSTHVARTDNPHAVTAAQAGAEPAAGNPGTNGYCWTSLTDGTRSWGACGTGTGGTPGGANKSVQYNNGGVFGGFGRYSSGALIL